jgi:membrane associated rhomboid family serine protease
MVGDKTMTDKNESLNKEKPKAEIGGLLVDIFRKPAEQLWITYSVIAICVVICAYLNLSEESSSYSRITEGLIPSSVLVWSGAFWGLLTSAFVHFDVWHIVFNMWWLKDFGKLLEPTMGRSRYFMFIIAAAVVSSGAELAFASQTGIGFSGVVYAMFGYALAARHVEPLYQRIITKQTTVWLLGWLILCVILTYTQAWRVANAAHIAGFLFGYCIGNAFIARVRAAVNKIALSALIVLAILSVVYMPWSDTWRHRGAFAKIIAMGDAAAAGNPDAQFRYAGILIQYGKKTEALSWLKKSASQNHVSAMNGLAWTLATDRDDKVRDGVEAVKLAENACQKDNWKNSQYVDTLAAAYAEVGRWEDAVKTQKLAISTAGVEDGRFRASYDARLQQYVKHEKVRE